MFEEEILKFADGWATRLRKVSFETSIRNPSEMLKR